MAPGHGEFERLKANCIKSGKLYEDPVFPAVNSSIYFSKDDKAIVWMRPGEICDNPQFFVDGASKRDLCQGKLGDCWFLAATALLATKRKLFSHVVPLHQSFEKGSYGGIFHFNFWQYGEWVEVIIDDRLPTKKDQATKKNKLFFCQNRSVPNEFWSALIEKAYAKLHGSYQALEIGYSNDALVDFTGGIGEFVELNTLPDKAKLFQMMKRLFSKDSLLCAALNVEDDKFEDKLSNGLVTGHAYSITNIIEITIGGKVLQLIRLRNPWGHKEWNGAWSDESPEWKKLSAEEKNRLELRVEDDGEFWMSFGDFASIFHDLQICHFTPDTAETGSGGHKWIVKWYNGAWVRGLTAGGSGLHPHEAATWKNPQFLVDLEAVDEKNNKASLVVSLMQKNSRQRKSTEKIAETELPIGFDIYKYFGGDRVDVTKCQKLNVSSLRIAEKMAQYEYFRERTSRFELDPGVYCIVPATLEPNLEGEFLLRMASERPIRAGEVGQEIEAKSVLVLTDAKESSFEKLYSECSGDDKVIDAKELSQLLNKGLKRAVDKEFSAATIRALIQAAAGEKATVLRETQCRQIWQKVILFQETFVQFDKDVSGRLDSSELEGAVAAIGVNLTKKDLASVVRKFCAKSDQLNMDEFVLVAAKAAFANDVFRKNRQGAASSPEEEEEDTITLTKSQVLGLML